MNKGFTLSEVLITLGIIGVVAAITLPAVINNIEDKQYNTAYKKVHSELSQILQKSLIENEWPYRPKDEDLDTTMTEWNIIKSNMQVIKECGSQHLNDCWPDGDKTSNGYPDRYSYSFIDISGRSWATYWRYQNIFFVDTNGFKGPNKWGKDRWAFTLADTQNRRVTTGYPSKIIIYIGNKDVLYSK